MSEPLAPGTICFLDRLKEMEAFNGRVVEVVAGPMFLPDEYADWYYSVEAGWMREQFPDAPLFLSARHHLKPIVPPDALHNPVGQSAERMPT